MEGKRKTQNANTRQFIIIGMSTAIVLVSPVLALLFVGYFFDNIFHTTPAIMTAGILLGFVSGVINVFKVMKVFQKQKQAKPML